jgi:hypothetical protein
MRKEVRLLLPKRRCRRCARLQPISEFYTCRGKPEARCKTCVRAARRKWYWADPNYARGLGRINYYRRELGVGFTEVDALLEVQQYRCGGCGADLSECGGFTLDHRHDVPKGRESIRGILGKDCGCNLALGLVRDRVETLLALVAYLKDPPARRALTSTAPAAAPPDSSDAA